MMRIIAENILLFLAPTLLWFGYVLMTRDDGASGTVIFKEAPLLWLIPAGAALVFLTLIVFSSREGGEPGKPYDPPVLRDGKIEPGHTRSQQ
jgi:hypothetical protein